ncbi:Desert hedgehog protein B (Desert hedgehog protein 2) (DHH-2) (Hedgehog protein 4) (X-HH4) [Cleaved into: Desert hedgehog protein B N-product [Durusdinium trenchii]|uniref:Desert hedgehog protein B (Desert hedgehog protein 2) (DHH-2) (Hedgehog protein 4) (X-HH4) [Cleaved into: Desert hedgehog protein B N-product n=1 Tax=Durusdinium trenchii TaxID=1381693 RepID=A0ABP0HJ75_9DINO
MPRADALSRLVGGDEPNEPSLGFRLRRADAAAEFLGPGHNGSRSSFFSTTIKFFPKTPELKEQEFSCDQDLGVCNRECEKRFGDRRAEFEEPCKLAVAQHFEAGCFPPFARVVERSGELWISQVQVGHELKTSAGWSPVIACLHSDAQGTFKYFSLNTANGNLSLTGDHLLRVQRDGHWQWRRAKDAREGDYLEDQEGQAVKILKITCLSWQGAYAPLTLHGELIVDGWRCSCFAPRWAFSHDWCQAAFAPLRVAHTAAQQIQLSQEGKDDLGYSGRLLGSFWSAAEDVWLFYHQVL